MVGLQWKRNDLLGDALRPEALASLRLKREAVHAALRRDHWCSALEAIQMATRNIHSPLASHLDESTVKIGKESDIDSVAAAALERAVRALIPWRKGPYEVCGRPIDAEWRSDMKWARIEPHLPPLGGARILDVGCNSGYYMFRTLGLAERQGALPEAVVGIDPSESFYLAFELMQGFAQRTELQYEALGVEEIGLFEEMFDLVLCLGIVYHQRDPLTMLRNTRAAMKSGGVLILESQAIPGDAQVALFPTDRYAKARNVYFVPTASCMCAWLARAGFKDIEVISVSEVTAAEQRQTALAPYESLKDFLDPLDSSKTVEGYPAPLRVAVRAIK